MIRALEGQTESLAVIRQIRYEILHRFGSGRQATEIGLAPKVITPQVVCGSTAQLIGAKPLKS
jgi:hypothetical protein